jgi:hypothetical protein
LVLLKDPSKRFLPPNSPESYINVFVHDREHEVKFLKDGDEIRITGRPFATSRERDGKREDFRYIQLERHEGECVV